MCKSTLEDNLSILYNNKPCESSPIKKLLHRTAVQMALNNYLFRCDDIMNQSLSFWEDLSKSLPKLCLILYKRRVKSYSNGIALRYKEFKRCAKFSPPIFREFFNPSIYAEILRDCSGFISPTKFINCCIKILYTSQIRAELGLLNTYNEYIERSDISNWIISLIHENSYPKFSSVTQLCNNNSSFIEFFVNYVTERIFFFCGVKGNKLSIQDLILSDTFYRFLEIRNADVNESDNNPFYPQILFQLFEWMEFRGHRIDIPGVDDFGKKRFHLLFFPDTLKQLLLDFEYIIPDLVISRIFEVHGYYGQTVMDSSGNFRLALNLKSILRLLFALECRETPQSISWFWNILNLNEKEYIDVDIINLFWKDMSICIEKTFSIDSIPRLEYICDEIFDMICPGNSSGRIYKDQFISSPMASTVISYLCDPKAFIALEMREEIIAQAANKLVENIEST
ncbi:uncharacterized protein CMU_020380 [Cryptosporidium muris RN66]|uniref:Uncharacterized protein n=1 Tax=Cryptosporidium muris (strain RN66) TaxID=441375 RepID=B6AJ57_CRYMR|nr:uncharacterized protein CMU_020380 [Cryptosporidium muris RN66]EEA08294.1 hypothetical protein, conserved [Cryptosporidium muris RN66]|eukprot:XP_002142643.1 hypothetical protein [Cryptosporidium muris RN66]